ncbi:hypothetical protein WR25_11699 [Diploscapter pachys]|uniref:Uncharacterized protein n=1 Tax=Diploscapter pachys TaxID=2018661 RepID=A0A2A2KP66_9BILA|nr:hypothetical protein WR25_11699 [Diploscapter pachys]
MAFCDTHSLGLGFQCMHWSIDLLGVVCLVFWLVLGFGILFRGWFVLRQPKAILWKFEKKNSVGASERIQTEGAVKNESKKDERANEKKSNSKSNNLAKKSNGSDEMKKKA